MIGDRSQECSLAWMAIVSTLGADECLSTFLLFVGWRLGRIDEDKWVIMETMPKCIRS